MPKSFTRLAATSSWVDSGFEAQRTRSAPPAFRVRARLAVSAVTCRQADIRIPASGFSLANRSRIARKHRHVTLGPFHALPAALGQ